MGMLAGAAIIFFAYIGFDSVSTHTEEAKNPQRDVPIGIIASLVLCTVLYIAVVAVLTVGLGWAVVPVLPALRGLLGAPGLALLAGGGVLYTLGAVVYASRRPDPFPRVFGYHEVFHALVVAAAALHLAVAASAVLALG